MAGWADTNGEDRETLLTTVIDTWPVRDIVAGKVPVNIQLAGQE